MGPGWDKVVVGLLVAGAAAWALRALVRSLRKPGKCSSCASGGNCPVAAQAAGRGDRTAPGASADSCDSRP